MNDIVESTKYFNTILYADDSTFSLCIENMVMDESNINMTINVYQACSHGAVDLHKIES